jgi:hypothetical protein
MEIIPSLYVSRFERIYRGEVIKDGNCTLLTLQRLKSVGQLAPNSAWL